MADVVPRCDIWNTLTTVTIYNTWLNSSKIAQHNICQHNQVAHHLPQWYSIYHNLAYHLPT